MFFYSGDGRVLHCQLTTAFSAEPLAVLPGNGTVEFSIEELPLQPGDYAVVASTRDAASREVGSWLQGVPLTVRAGRMVRGNSYLPHAWRHQRAGRSSNDARSVAPHPRNACSGRFCISRTSWAHDGSCGPGSVDTAQFTRSTVLGNR